MIWQSGRCFGVAIRPCPPRRIDTISRDGAAGFTLIETLVALTVLATAAVALIGATQAHLDRIAELEQRAAAQWAGENAQAEAALGLEPAGQPVTMLGYSFDIDAERSATEDPAVDKLTLRVTSGGDVVLARVTGFVLDPVTAARAAP